MHLSSVLRPVFCVYTTFSKGVEVVAVLVHRAASPTLLSLTVGVILHRKLQCGNVDLFTLDMQCIFNQYWLKASTRTLLFSFAVSIIPGKKSVRLETLSNEAKIPVVSNEG